MTQCTICSVNSVFGRNCVPILYSDSVTAVAYAISAMLSEPLSMYRRTQPLFICVALALTACGGGAGNGDEIDMTIASTPPPASGGTGNIEVAWTPPTEKADGSALTDLAGYRLYVGSNSGQYEDIYTVDNPGLSRYVVDNLEFGTYYVAMTAFRSNGVESELSNEVQKATN